MRIQLCAIGLSVVLLTFGLACGSDSGGGGEGAGEGEGEGAQASCTLDISAPVAHPKAGVAVSSTAQVNCTAAADLQLEVCLQWDVGNGFEDVICESSSASDAATLSKTVESNCIGSKTFRTKVTASANGANLAGDPSESVVVNCQ